MAKIQFDEFQLKDEINDRTSITLSDDFINKEFVDVSSQASDNEFEDYEILEVEEGQESDLIEKEFQEDFLMETATDENTKEMTPPKSSDPVVISRLSKSLLIKFKFLSRLFKRRLKVFLCAKMNGYCISENILQFKFA